MSDLKHVATIVANESMRFVPDLIADERLPNIRTGGDAMSAIEAVVTQDAPLVSKRIWAALFGALAAVLAVPEVQALMGQWAPVVTALASAGLAVWSKSSDVRPMA